MQQMLTVMERGGNVLIPKFAFHRSQEMAKRLDVAIEKGILPRYNVYTISNLAHRIDGYFNQNRGLFTKWVKAQKTPFNYRYVRHLYRTQQIVEPAVVICTSGFGHAGASLRLLTDWAPDKNNCVILTSGYLPPNSPLKKAKEEAIFETEIEVVRVKAEVRQIELSGHADQNELVEFVRKLRPNRTLLVHGDLEQAELLSEKISNLTDVSIPKENEVFDV
jgi:Cft2 family RNA processing exonuclease